MIRLHTRLQERIRIITDQAREAMLNQIDLIDDELRSPETTVQEIAELTTYRNQLAHRIFQQGA